MILDTRADEMAKSDKMQKRLEKAAEDLTPEEVANLAEWEEDADIFLRKLAETLVSLRVKKGLYQKDISRILGRSKSWVGQVENAENHDHRSVKLYASALGVEYSSVVAMAEYKVVREHETREMAKKLNLDVENIE